jgi:competence protein ComEA
MVSGSRSALWGATIVILAIALRAAPASHAQATPQDPAPAPALKTSTNARSEALMLRVCGQCHDWERVGETRRTKDDWGRLLDDMFSRGASGSDDDYSAVLDYVLRNDGLVNVNRAPADELAVILNLTADEAGAIVKDRTANGKFADFEALKRVAGVDSKKLEAARKAMFY